jgi:hypothetical protein
MPVFQGDLSYITLHWHLHRTTFSTHFSSTLLTSFLNRSTSCQQSNGLRSFPLKHFTTSSLAFSTSLSNTPTSTTFFRFSSLCLRSSILCWMTARLSVRRLSSSEELLGSEGESSDDNLAERSLNVCSSRSWRRLSSSATRAWTWSSSVLARVESLCRD